MPKTAPFHLRLPRYSHLQPLAQVFSFTFTISFKLESFRCSLNPTKTPTRLTFLDHVSEDPCTVPSFSSLFSSSSTRKSFNSRGLHLRGMLGLRNLSDLELSPLLTLSYVDGLCDCKLQVTRLWEQKPENLLGAGLLLVSFKQPFLLSDNSNVDHCPQRGDRCCSSPLWKRSP